jgi:hypothetical protein
MCRLLSMIPVIQEPLSFAFSGHCVLACLLCMTLVVLVCLDLPGCISVDLWLKCTDGDLLGTW